MGALKSRFADRAKALRANSTDAERRLWAILRSRQAGVHKFVSQLPIGRYIADFVCRELALIIEVDGGQHADSQSDVIRTEFLNAEGYDVLRLWNSEVLTNAAGVFEAIELTATGHPSPDWRFSPADLSPEGRGARGIIAAINSAKGRTPPPPSGERSAAGRVRGDSPEPAS